MAEPTKIPFSNATIGQRAASNSVDAKLVNVYLEKDPAGEIWAVMRPGTTPSLTPTTPGTPWGAFFWNGDVYSVSNGTLWKNGSTNLGAVDVTAGTTYWFNASLGATPRLFLHNTTNAYYYDAGGGLVAAAAANAYVPFKGGSAYLDGTMYLPNDTSAINGSGINDLTTWDALNVIKTQMLSDHLVATFRQLSYVVALCSQSVQAFVDAGNPSGSPLAVASGTFLPYGCASADSLQLIEDTALWVASNSNGGLSVMALENMKPRIVSNPAVERLLQAPGTANFRSLSFRISGHRFYVLTIIDTNISIVLDLTMGEWSYWSASGGGAYPYYYCTTNASGQTLLQDVQGNLVLLTPTSYRDNSSAAYSSIPVQIVTPQWEGGTRTNKYLHRLIAKADQAVTASLTVRYSDDDYQTWSNPLTIPLNSLRPELYQLGTFRKRAFDLRYSANAPLRLRELELDASLCSV